MLAAFLSALGALGSIARLVKAALTGLAGVILFRKGEEAQAGKDAAAETAVLKAEADAAASAPETVAEVADEMKKGTF